MLQLYRILILGAVGFLLLIGITPAATADDGVAAPAVAEGGPDWNLENVGLESTRAKWSTNHRVNCLTQ